MIEYLNIEENKIYKLEKLKELFYTKIKTDELVEQCTFKEWLEENLVENKGFLMKVVLLQMSEWDECNNNIITDFFVSKKWLQNNINVDLGSGDEEGTFLGEYTSGDVYPLHELALLENVIIKEQVYK